MFLVIFDFNDDILLFLLIINGDHIIIIETMIDFFIDVIGWDQWVCEVCLMLVCLFLYERGGSIESVRVVGWDGEISVILCGDVVRYRVLDCLIGKVLGFDLGFDEIVGVLVKMGGWLIELRIVIDGVNKVERWVDCVVGEREHMVEMLCW